MEKKLVGKEISGVIDFDDYYNMSTATEVLDLSPSTFLYWLRKGEIEGVYHKVAGCNLFLKKHIEQKKAILDNKVASGLPRNFSDAYAKYPSLLAASVTNTAYTNANSRAILTNPQIDLKPMIDSIDKVTESIESMAVKLYIMNEKIEAISSQSADLIALKGAPIALDTIINTINEVKKSVKFIEDELIGIK